MCLIRILIQEYCRPIIMPPPPEAASPYILEKDAGFCSGGDDDDSEESLRSNSDDSGLKMGTTTVKRKVPQRETAPLKKRIRYEEEETVWDRVPPHPGVRPQASAFSVEALLETAPLKAAAPQQQRNYKNMTRERRIEANARERTRVHTISAAFDTLRRSIPAYSHNQKLSKLSVLRIACSYIAALSRVAGTENCDEGPTLSECVDSVTKTIQTEGKLRKRREDS